MWRETDYGGDGAAGQKKHGLVGLILHSHLASGSKNCGHSGSICTSLPQREQVIASPPAPLPPALLSNVL